MKTKSVFYLIKSFQILTLLLFVSCSKNDDSNNSEPNSPANIPEDAYIGTWTSTTSTGASFTGFPVYAILIYNSDNTAVNGEFFVSPKTYNSSINDGTIVMQLEGSTVTSFFLNDTLLNCTGMFNGTGQIASDGTFIINFTGTDCDGEHVGEMIFNKVE